MRKKYTWEIYIKSSFFIVSHAIMDKFCWFFFQHERDDKNINLVTQMKQNHQELSEIWFILCSEVLMCQKWYRSCDLPAFLQTAVSKYLLVGRGKRGRLHISLPPYSKFHNNSDTWVLAIFGTLIPSQKENTISQWIPIRFASSKLLNSSLNHGFHIPSWMRENEPEMTL